MKKQMNGIALLLLGILFAMAGGQLCWASHGNLRRRVRLLEQRRDLK